MFQCFHFVNELQAAYYQQRLLNVGVPDKRSFFLPATGRREYLGDFYELWLGLFQSVVLGNIPLLNVDVNHKAFPKRYNSLIDMFPDMQQDMRMNIDPNQPLDRFVVQALQKHLGGLEICYRGPGAPRVSVFLISFQYPFLIKFVLHFCQIKIIKFTISSTTISYYNLILDLQIHDFGE